MTRGRRAKPNWAKGDRVAVDFDGTLYEGTIVLRKDNTVEVKFDDGDFHEVNLLELVHPDTLPKADIEPDDIIPSMPVSTRQPGFNQYGIEWRDVKRRLLQFKRKRVGTGDNPKHAMYFRAKYITDNGSVEFVGEIAKTRDTRDSTILYVAWIYARFKGTTLAVPTVVLGTRDPRDCKYPLSGIESINADICAAMNRWLYDHLHGDLQRLEDLIARAERPFIEVRRVETLDRIILKLKEFRDTALRSGGTRTATIEGDTFSKNRRGKPPVLGIVVDVTTQALGLKGRPPSLLGGALLDSVSETKGGKRGQLISGPITPTPDAKNVADLQQQLVTLNERKRKGDVQAASEARRIRATLRRMGHRGGARNNKNGKDE